MFGLLFFILLTIFLITRLNSVLGIHVGYTVEKEKLPDFDESDIQESTLSELDQKVLQLKKIDASFDIDDFINKSRKAFEMIFSAYSQEDKETLKALMDPRIYRAFALAIDDRQKRGEKLEGVIVRFIESEVQSIDIDNSDCKITVKFVTEQSDVLRNSSGDIIEGNPDFVQNHTDIWVFSRDLSSNNPSWYLSEIGAE